MFMIKACVYPSMSTDDKYQPSQDLDAGSRTLIPHWSGRKRLLFAAGALLDSQTTDSQYVLDLEGNTDGQNTSTKMLGWKDATVQATLFVRKTTNLGLQARQSYKNERVAIIVGQYLLPARNHEAKPTLEDDRGQYLLPACNLNPGVQAQHFWDHIGQFINTGLLALIGPSAGTINYGLFVLSGLSVLVGDSY
ncbi:uncharacterized protein LACBIDRAFT_334077 [Laccaria bicolor S238N-H82]|uniref:Predicted protein n=1 Tax=Laccaria bicolor (strain S238N-H82 / ATCC MYA-4686) TaxID=486041 RepID=B0DY05_LACBS|nr:uncharacterized protein LACBIDRAFT_334077 [Laccaria bicolor S238N-H82]EDR00557.1 predicted protein [Laccaria bicolor S238N-H82]|eukprot:XP_001888784.1 predicted protein [Laccaria bicolor S238N-H82]